MRKLRQLLSRHKEGHPAYFDYSLISILFPLWELAVLIVMSLCPFDKPELVRPWVSYKDWLSSATEGWLSNSSVSPDLWPLMMNFKTMKLMRRSNSRRPIHCKLKKYIIYITKTVTAENENFRGANLDNNIQMQSSWARCKAPEQHRGFRGHATP